MLVDTLNAAKQKTSDHKQPPVITPVYLSRSGKARNDLNLCANALVQVQIPVFQSSRQSKNHKSSHAAFYTEKV